MNRSRQICKLGTILSSLLTAEVSKPAEPIAPIPPEAQIEATEEKLFSTDIILSSSFKADFEIEIHRNLLGPDKGKHRKLCRFSRLDGAMGLSVETKYENDPPYGPPGEGYREFDFDHDSNLVIWRSLRKTSFSSANYNRSIDELERILVAPNGAILERGRHSIIYEYPVGSHENFYEVDQFMMGAGRGFKDRTDRRKSGYMLANGDLQLVFSGNFGSGLRGDWYLYVEPQSGLVRQADLFTSAADRPSIHVESNGEIVREGITLSQQGVLAFSIDEQKTYSLTLKITDFSSDPKEKDLEQTRTIVDAPLPRDAEIVDFRTSPPRRISAGDK